MNLVLEKENVLWLVIFSDVRGLGVVDVFLMMWIWGWYLCMEFKIICKDWKKFVKWIWGEKVMMKF